MSEYQQLGTDLRALLVALLGQYGGTGTYGAVSGYTGGAIPTQIPDPAKVVAAINVSARFKSGALLLALQKSGKIYIYDPDEDQFEIVAALYNTPMVLWRAVIDAQHKIYLAMSGTRRLRENNPFEVLFGQGGGLLKLDNSNEFFAPIPLNVPLQDPSHIVFTSDGARMLVVDFEGFGGSGTIYLVDHKSGVAEVLVRGGMLRDPCACTIGDDGYLYVANPHQSYGFQKDSDGKWIKDWGSIVRVNMETKEMETIYDEAANPKGGVVGVKAVAGSDTLLVLRSDWPAMTSSAVLSLSLKTRRAVPLIEATPSAPRFFAHDAVALRDGTLYVVDSYFKEMLLIDWKKGKIVDRRSMKEILGPTIGMTTSMETVESIDVIP